MVHALRSRRVVTPKGEREAAVVIDGDRIAAVLPTHEMPDGMPCEDLGELALLPGLVDTHTHINEPGRTEWEGFVTGTRAAAAGGYTTIVDMPLNNLPETTNVRALEVKRAAARGKCLVDYALWGGAVDGNGADLLLLAKAGVAGFKSFLIYPGCEGFTSIDREHLERALPDLVTSGLPLLVHAELAGPIETATARLRAEGADWRQYRTYLASRPDEAELEAIEMLLQLCRTYRFRLHIVHVSTALALPTLAAAKREGLPVTAETCPHYLHLTAEGIGDGATLCKCAPPIRSAANREALWAGLLDGTLDLIATDHSPCPPAMKRLKATEAERFDEAWGGIASLSTALRVLWTECAQRGVSLTKVAQWMSAAPARLAGLEGQVGSIEPGKLANFVAFDPAALAVLTPEQLFYRHPLSPYLGETLHGAVRSTWLRGERVYEDGQFAKQLRGRELERPAFIVADTSLPATLRAWNAFTAGEALEAVLPCNGSHTWAAALAARRPFRTAEALFLAADEVWRALPKEAWQAAFDSHPRIGHTHAKAATERSLGWSAGEQAQVQTEVQAHFSDGADLQAELAEGNRAYEARFGRIFLICATGKSAAEILAALQGRLRNEPNAELLEAAEQQRRITQLRLRKWLGLPAAGCEGV